MPPTYTALASAFTALNASGVIARHNYYDCQTCGYAAIEEEIKAAVAPVSGIVFYHEQKTERAAADGLLLLHHSASGDNPSKEEHRAVALTVISALRDAGFAPIWNGSPSMCIEIAIDADSMARQFFRASVDLEWDEEDDSGDDF